MRIGIAKLMVDGAETIMEWIQSTKAVCKEKQQFCVNWSTIYEFVCKVDFKLKTQKNKKQKVVHS